MRFRSFYRIFFYQKMYCAAKQTMKSIGLASALTLCVSLNVNAQALVENMAQLRANVAQFLTDEYSNTQAVNVTVTVGNLDNRLRLAKCDHSLLFILKDPTNNGGNINVEVTCKGASAWTILVPALARVYRPVAVASRNLERGSVVSDSDLTTDIKDVSDFRMGFCLTPDAILGKEVKYTINKGETFRASALNTPLVIKRGDTVSMEAHAGDINVKTNGTAVSDGRLGQQIRVKNNQSARIINAKVMGPGKVQTIM